MKEKLTPDAPGYHVSNKNCAIEVVGFNKNSPCIVVAGYLRCHHLCITEIPIAGNENSWERKEQTNLSIR